MEISKEFLKKLKDEFESCRTNRIAQRAATNTGLLEASVDRFEDKINQNRHTFNINLKETEVRNQKKSGRCWMFASLNLMEYKLCQKNNLKEFELSQNYTLFYDKLERSHYFLQSIVKTFDQDVHGRLVSHLLTDPMGDGGQWDMLKNIVKKYGIVPKYSMPETENSSNTSSMDSYLTKMLRMFAKDLRNAHENGKSDEEIQKIIEEDMKAIYRTLCICLGTPPSKIDFEARDKDDKFISHKNLGPNEFFDKFVGMNLDDYISVINAPTKDKPYYKSYTVKYLGNVVEGDIVRYVNVPIEEMKKMVLKQLQSGEPVWFGCDVGQNFYRQGSRLDLESLRVDELLGVDFKFNKEERLDYKESLMTHAMVFMGCDYDEEKDKINRYRVENSWGKDAGYNGFLVMSDEWFNEYMYQVLINKKNISQEIVEAYESKPTELEPWDPMGSLA